MIEAAKTRKSYLPTLIVLGVSSVALAADNPMFSGDVMHRMMLLSIQMGVILFAAKIGNILFEKIYLPGALGEMIVGIVIGPYCLGGLSFYGFQYGVFPTFPGLGVSPELYGLCNIAAIVLMFMIGLETDLKMLFRYSMAGFAAGVGGVVISFVFAAGMVVVFSERLFGQYMGWMSPPALIMGIVSTATSVGITARILSEKRKLDTPEGVTIVSAAVIDDIIGVILLAVVMAIATATRSGGKVNWGHIAAVGVKAIGVWLAATVIGLAASRKISFLLKWFGKRTSMAIMALGLALVVGGLFEEAGLAMIIGAYVMGMSLSKADISHVIRENLHPIYVFLVPVFFCVSGMRIDMGAFTNPSMVAFGVAGAVVGLIAKVIGCGGAVMMTNFNWRGALRVGFGMAPRCEVSLIIAGVGLTQGLITSELFACSIIMILFNTFIAPPALLLLFRNPARGTRKAISTEDEARNAVRFNLPSPEMTEFLTNKLSSIFQSEGYFVHLLDHDRQLYQLRKDDVIIDMQQSDSELVFYCSEADVALVNTAMYEAVAALEQAIRGLKEPLDSGAVATRLQTATPINRKKQTLAGYLRPELVEPDLKGETKEEIIEELLDILHRNGMIKDRDEAVRAVWDREQSMSTGLQYGVAIPHGKTDTVRELVCAVGLKKTGIDYGSMDGQPSKIFILTISPKSKPAPHVRFMSVVSQVLDDEGRARILSCKKRQELYRALSQ